MDLKEYLCNIFRPSKTNISNDDTRIVIDSKGKCHWFSDIVVDVIANGLLKDCNQGTEINSKITLLKTMIKDLSIEDLKRNIDMNVFQKRIEEHDELITRVKSTVTFLENVFSTIIMLDKYTGSLPYKSNIIYQIHKSLLFDKVLKTEEQLKDMNQTKRFFTKFSKFEYSLGPNISVDDLTSELTRIGVSPRN